MEGFDSLEVASRYGLNCNVIWHLMEGFRDRGGSNLTLFAACFSRSSRMPPAQARDKRTMAATKTSRAFGRRRRDKPEGCRGEHMRKALAGEGRGVQSMPHQDVNFFAPLKTSATRRIAPSAMPSGSASGL